MNLSAQIELLSRITDVDTVLFTKHLSVMIKAGIPLPEAIDSITAQTTNQRFKHTLIAINHDIRNGQSFYTSLAKHPRIFNPLYLNLVRIGEESGNLEKNLEYLAVQLKKQYEFKNKIQSALLYPEIVLTTAAVVGFGISYFVLPQLVDLFSSLDIKLPLTTRILLFVATSMKRYGLSIITAFIASIVGLRLFISLPGIKLYWHRFLLSLPVMGAFFQDVELSSLCRNFGIMLKSGLPIEQGLEAQKQTTENLVYREYIEAIQQGIDKGQSIENVLIKAKFSFMPLIVIKMIGVGEKTGKLDESLLYLGDFFEDEADTTAKNFSTVLEPIILIGVGLVVAFIALSIISPIYQFTGSIKR